MYIEERVAAYKQRYTTFDDVRFLNWYYKKCLLKGWKYFQGWKDIKTLNKSRNAQEKIKRLCDD